MEKCHSRLSKTQFQTTLMIEVSPQTGLMQLHPQAT
jgi:hypothetical protein